MHLFHPFELPSSKRSMHLFFVFSRVKASRLHVAVLPSTLFAHRLAICDDDDRQAICDDDGRQAICDDDDDDDRQAICDDDDRRAICDDDDDDRQAIFFSLLISFLFIQTLFCLSSLLSCSFFCRVKFLTSTIATNFQRIFFFFENFYTDFFFTHVNRRRRCRLPDPL